MPVRPKIAVTDRGGDVLVRVEWIEVTDQTPGRVVFTEEFCTSGRQGASYVSNVECDAPRQLPVTFWLDPQGLRHFYAKADPGLFNSCGSEI